MQGDKAKPSVSHSRRLCCAERAFHVAPRRAVAPAGDVQVVGGARIGDDGPHALLFACRRGRRRPDQCENQEACYRPPDALAEMAGRASYRVINRAKNPRRVPIAAHNVICWQRLAIRR